MIATSLLVCGPWDQAGSAQANITQRMTTREDELEDLISVVGQSFLGMTINCARCHAHKFDPISHEDYYRFKALLDGVYHGERAIEPPEYYKRLNELTERLNGVEQQMATLRAVGKCQGSGGKESAR